MPDQMQPSDQRSEQRLTLFLCCYQPGRRGKKASRGQVGHSSCSAEVDLRWKGHVSGNRTPSSFLKVRNESIQSSDSTCCTLPGRMTRSCLTSSSREVAPSISSSRFEEVRSRRFRSLHQGRQHVYGDIKSDEVVGFTRTKGLTPVQGVVSRTENDITPIDYDIPLRYGLGTTNYRYGYHRTPP